MDSTWITYIINKDTFAMMIAAYLVLKTTRALNLLTLELKAHRVESDTFCETLTVFVSQIAKIMQDLNLTSQAHTHLISELQLHKMEKEQEKLGVQ